MKDTLFAIATVIFSIFALVSIRSPLMPLFATAGALSGAHLLTVHPGSKSRRRQLFEAEVEAREREIEQKQHERSQLVQVAKTELQTHQSYLEEKEQQLNQYKEQLIQQEKEMRQWAEEHQQRVMSLAVKTLHENHQLKQPDLPEGATYEDMIAREICQILYTGGVIVKKPFVRPFEGGFEMTFTILPATPDLDSSGQEKHYVRSLGEALRVIQKDLLVDIQTLVYAADKLPEIVPVYEGLKLTCYLNHFQGQYPIKDGEQKPQKALISEYGMAGGIANEIIDHCLANGIRLDFVDACQYKDHEAMCWFKPNTRE